MSEDEQPMNPVSGGSPPFPPPPGPPSGVVPPAGPPPIVSATTAVPAADVPWTAPGPDTTWQPHTTTISTDPTLAPPNYVEPAPPKKGKGKKIALAVASVVVVAAGAVAVVAVASGKDRGGAASPQAAIQELVKAANQQDMLGVLDIVLPAERRTWGDPLETMWSEAKRLQVLSPAADLGGVKGVDLEMELTPGEPDPVADDISIVPVKGQAKGAVDLAALPIGSLLTGAGVDLSGGGRSPRNTTNLDGRIATVKRNGRWYVSLWYSVAEAYRQRAGLDWPSIAQGLQPKGSADPATAVKDMLHAIENLSISDVLSRMNPDEVEVLQRVAPWFVQSAQANIDRISRQPNFSLKFADPTLVTRTDGDHASVEISQFGFELQLRSLDIKYADGCVTVTGAGIKSVKQCPTGGAGVDQTVQSQLDSMGLGGLSERATKLSDDLRAALADMQSAGVTVRKVGGQWYVSPLGTGFDGVIGLMKALDNNELKGLIDDVKAMAGAIADSTFSDSTSSSSTDSGSTDSGSTDSGFSDSGFSDPGFSDPGFTDSGFTDSGFTDSGFTDSTDGYSSAYDKCENQATFPDALACVKAGMTAGKIKPGDVINGSFLAPECGWQGFRYDLSLTGLADADYVKKAADASACFLTKVAAGTITAQQVPFEVTKPDCLVGKNPSHMTSTESDTYFRCLIGN